MGTPVPGIELPVPGIELPVPGRLTCGNMFRYLVLPLITLNTRYHVVSMYISIFLCVYACMFYVFMYQMESDQAQVTWYPESIATVTIQSLKVPDKAG